MQVGWGTGEIWLKRIQWELGRVGWGGENGEIGGVLKGRWWVGFGAEAFWGFVMTGGMIYGLGVG